MKKKTLVSEPLKDFSSFNRKVGKGNEKFLKMLIERRLGEKMLEAIIITTGKRDTKEILRLNDQELYENIKLFDLRKLTGLNKIVSMVPIIDLFGKMLTNKILITNYKTLYFKDDTGFEDDSEAYKVKDITDYTSYKKDCGRIALRGDINSLKNFIRAVITFNFCAYRKDMIGVFNYTYLGNGEGLEEDLEGIKESRDRKFDTYVFPELEKELQYASDPFNKITREKQFVSRKCALYNDFL